jgi:hypothetical protein
MTIGNNRRSPFLRAVARPIQRSNSSGRIIRYRFSTPQVARDLHTIAAWKLDNFRSNPVFLWAHDKKAPPIGKVVEVEDSKGYLDGSVEYVDRDTYPFADTIFQLVRGGYLNAVSTCWDPLEWKPTTDRSRPGGIDFKLVDLLELSQVPVPALPAAVAAARAAGIEVRPIGVWAERALDQRNSAMSQTSLLNLRQAAGVPKLFKSRTTVEQRRIAARQKKAALLRKELDRTERERRMSQLRTPEQRRRHAAAVKKQCAKSVARAPR